MDARHKAGHDGGEVRRGHDSGERNAFQFVMAGLVPAIHVLRVLQSVREDVDARHKAGHDGVTVMTVRNPR